MHNFQNIQDSIISEEIVVLKDTIAQINHSLKLDVLLNDDGQLTSNIITISLALIAALIALYQVKSNIISSSRITWIENLRASISEYVAEASYCSTILRNLFDDCKNVPQSERSEIVKKYYPSYTDSYKKIDQHGNKVLLYLNSDESNHYKIERLIQNIDNILDTIQYSELVSLQIDDDIKEIVKTSKLIFKEEWTKSKRIFKL